MIRTTKATKINYAVFERDEDGTMSICNRTAVINESDKKKALKTVRKAYGEDVAIIGTEVYTEMYIMEDDFFFANARVATEEERAKYLKENA